MRSVLQYSVDNESSNPVKLNNSYRCFGQDGKKQTSIKECTLKSLLFVGLVMGIMCMQNLLLKIT